MGLRDSTDSNKQEHVYLYIFFIIKYEKEEALSRCCDQSFQPLCMNEKIGRYELS